ncbi:MAG: hypothetical protein KAS32_05945 [Candidatus Peribacteraceae bacterium]|nr:hypothetical protein [Candidatus Peribacteraceae bacterium]
MSKVKETFEIEFDRERTIGGIKDLISGARVSVNFHELNDLVGQILTLIDATYPDKEQRTAQKTIFKQKMYDWMRNIFDWQHQDKKHVSEVEKKKPLKVEM